MKILTVNENYLLSNLINLRQNKITLGSGNKWKRIIVED